jgi:hypothetical protein
MARAWGQRPSSLLGLGDPLAAYQFDSAVFSLEEAIDAALGRERRRLDLQDLDRKGRDKVKAAERAMDRVVDRILHGAPPKPVGAPKRPVEYVWNDDRTLILGFRYAGEAA